MKPWRQAVAEFKRAYLRDMLTLTQGNVMQAASVAGLTRTSMHNLLRKFQMRASAYRPEGSRYGNRGKWGDG
jgi:DNA-binding NtrC family response regulator